MGNFGTGFFRFMQGRYGFDQLGQTMGIGVIVLWIVAVIFGVFSNVFGIWTALISTVLNWLGLLLLAVVVFRMLSRNHERRRAENEWFLARRARRQNRQQAKKKDLSSRPDNANADTFTYLTCSFCGQQMRVPSGKGKVAVKCPACGEKTIVKS